MERDELLALMESIATFGKQLHQLILDTDSVSGRLYALDSLIDQTVIDLGLTNDVKRKLAKDVLRDKHEFYRDWESQLADLKHEKMSVAYERDSKKMELDIELTDIKRSTSIREGKNITDWIDQSNYVEATKQASEFSL